MYTIVLDNNKNLTTTIKEPLLYHSTSDAIQFLLPPEYDGFSGLVCYRGSDGIVRSEDLLGDEELYKGKVRLVIPSNGNIFNMRGMLEIWLELERDWEPEPEEEYEEEEEEESEDEEPAETEPETFVSRTTTLFIEEIPRDYRHRNKNDNTIYITRGDSLTVTITLVDENGYPYETQEGDIIYFRVKKSAYAADILIEKEVDLDTYEIDFVESDTKDLAFGEYRYEVEVVTEQDDHYTVIKNAPFIIGEELR